MELKLALDQEQQKSRKLVESMKKLDEEMRRTDELLYQMIPRQVTEINLHNKLQFLLKFNILKRLQI